MGKRNMFRSFLSQSELISYILVGLLVVGVTIGLYEWGVPIIQKNTLSSQISNLQQQINELANDIQNVGLNGGQTSLQLQVSSGSVSVYNNKILYTASVSGTYYNPNLKEVPVNYLVYYPCVYNNTISISTSQPVNICGYPGLYAYVNQSSNELVINDSLFNSVLELPLNSYNNVITSGFVFNIEYQNGQITFVPLYNTGIYGNSNYPACIVNAIESPGILQYEVECRPLYDPQNGICYWIYIQPSGITTLTGSGVATISQQGYNLETSGFESTICKAVEQIYVTVSL